MRLAGQQRDWEELADLDPYWAIASAPDKRFGGWGAEELMATGRAPIARLMRRAEELGRPEGRGAALDFGCGVGRLTRSLAEHFEECVGVDISDRMVAEARRLNADHPGCRFVVNATDDLSLFEEGSFDLIHTRLVLQHLPGVEVIGSYLREFVRVLRPGGLLAFQMPSSIARRNRLQPQRRLYSALRRAGAPVLHPSSSTGASVSSRSA